MKMPSALLPVSNFQSSGARVTFAPFGFLVAAAAIMSERLVTARFARPPFVAAS